MKFLQNSCHSSNNFPGLVIVYAACNIPTPVTQLLSEAAKVCGGSLIGANWVLTAGHCVEPVQFVFSECSDCLQVSKDSKLRVAAKITLLNRIVVFSLKSVNCILTLRFLWEFMITSSILHSSYFANSYRLSM